MLDLRSLVNFAVISRRASANSVKKSVKFTTYICEFRTFIFYWVVTVLVSISITLQLSDLINKEKFSTGCCPCLAMPDRRSARARGSASPGNVALAYAFLRFY